MKRLTVDEVKVFQLEILEYVQKFCLENDIKFWLDSGTLLGAVRHGGYIPWDDDIDIGMLREDYDKFIYAFNGTNDRYRCCTVENTSGFGYPFAKVLDMETILYEPDERGTKLNINIDVFVFDNAPDDDVKVEKMFSIRDRLRIFRQLKFCKGRSSTSNILKKIVIFIASALFQIFPTGYFDSLIVKNSKKYADKETKRVGNFCGANKFVCDKSVFDDFIWMEFEKKKFLVPIGYDKWLKSSYGNYMELPPIEKRKTHHTYVAYKLEEDEK